MVLSKGKRGLHHEVILMQVVNHWKDKSKYSSPQRSISIKKGHAHLDEFSRLLWDTVVWPCLEVKVKDSSWLSSGNQTAFPTITFPT